MKLSKIVTEATLPPVRSIADLYQKAKVDPRYKELALTAASNLGGSAKTLDQAIQWLYTNADETDEEGVVDEINFVRDLVGSGAKAPIHGISSKDVIKNKKNIKEYTASDVEDGKTAGLPTVDGYGYPSSPNRVQDLRSFISKLKGYTKTSSTTNQSLKYRLFNKWVKDAENKLWTLEDDPDHYN
jgi:hypothetical protein